MPSSSFFRGMMLAVTLCASTAPIAAAAQIRSVDPNEAIDADLAPLPSKDAPAAPLEPAQDSTAPAGQSEGLPVNAAPPANSAGATASAATGTGATTQSATYQQGDLIGAAEGVFGKGAQGLAGLIQKVLKEQGEPNAYITGEEASGAFVVGLRYGSGMLHHKVEGNRKVFWTGPSVGFDVGGNAGKSFVLVYNLFDSQELYRRYPQGEGAGYFVGGFTASYLRRGDVVLIPIRVGAGMRLGANIGYMKFSEKGRWLPF